MRPQWEIKHFLHLYLTNGHKMADAYRDAFGKGNWQRKSQWVAGSRLFNAPSTQKMYKGIMERKIKSASEVLAKLSEHAEASEKDISLRALRMLGEYHKLFTQKVEASNPEVFEKIMKELQPDLKAGEEWLAQQERNLKEPDSDSISGKGLLKLDMNLTGAKESATPPPPDLKLSSEDQGLESPSPPQEKGSLTH